jgi:hypothetical protein
MYENWFYINNGDGSFTKVTDSPLVNEATWSSGSAWGDYDKDGDLDLAVGGYDGVNLLFNNDGSGHFEKAEDNEFVNDGSYTQGLAWADYDDDGDLDIFTAKNNFFGGNNSMFLNNGNSNSWLKVKLISYIMSGNTFGSDARIYVKANINGQEVIQMRGINSQSGGGQGGQGEMIQFFGLGDATTIEYVKVVSYFFEFIETNVDINQTLELILAIENVEEQKINQNPLLFVYPNPTSKQVAFKISGDSETSGNISVFDIQGRLIKLIHDGILSENSSELTWNLKNKNGTRVNPGVYFCRWVIGDEVGSEKIIVK